MALLFSRDNNFFDRGIDGFAGKETPEKNEQAQVPQAD